MKKTISIILIITIISSIFFPHTIFAYDDTSKMTMDDAKIDDYDTFQEDIENGSSKVGETDDKKPYKIEEGTTNSVIKTLVKMGNIIPTLVRVFMTILTDDNTTTDVNNTYGVSFSIQKLVFNKIPIFDINFFSVSENDTDLQINIKDIIARMYYIFRDLAIVSTLVILIYTGIRMALASIAMEKAKYKKMIFNWLVGFIILMILPYIMIIIVKIGEVLIDLCESIMVTLCGDQIKNIEESLLNTATTSTEKGFSLIIPSIIYWVLTFYQLKFFWMYGKRLFSTAFLIVISPIILIKYIFDNGQGTTFKSWMTEFSLNVLIQPLHAVLYMIFMSIASNIMTTAPILSIIFLTALSRGERVLRNILRVKNSVTVQSMNDNLKASNLKKLGS